MACVLIILVSLCPLMAKICNINTPYLYNSMKIKHFFYALLALAFVGCSDDKYEGEEDTPVVTPTDEVKVTGYLGSYTRVNISQYGTSTQAFWSNGDQIALSTATQNNLKYQTSLSTATATKATFKAIGDKLADTEGETVYAVYPATDITGGVVSLPATDVWKEGISLPFAYAVCTIGNTTLDLTFKYVFGYVKLNMNTNSIGAATGSDGESTVTSVLVSTNSSQPLAVKSGKFNLKTQQVTIDEGSNEIKLTLNTPYNPAQLAEKSVFIPVLPIKPQETGEKVTFQLLHEHDGGCDVLQTIEYDIPATGLGQGTVHSFTPEVESFLKSYIKNPNFKLGMAVNAHQYSNINSDYNNLFEREVNDVVADNAMKYSSVVNNSGGMNFSTVEAFVDAAEATGHSLFGHTLAWHSQQNPTYLNSLLKPKRVKPESGETYEKEDFYCNYKTMTSFDYWNQTPEGASITLENNGLMVYNPSATEVNWNFQFHVANGISLEANDYKLTMRIKGSQAGSLVACLGHWGEDYPGATLNFTTEWKDVSVNINKVPASDDSFIMLQSGSYVGTYEIEWIKISHDDFKEEFETKEYLVNGDAEGSDYSCFHIQEVGSGIIPANVTEMGKGAGGTGRAYVVNATDDGAGNDWDAQFFVTWPEELPMDTEYTFTMKYRADKNASGDSQMHSTPGDYLSSNAIGSLDFTTQWKTVTYKGIITDPSARTIAFNLWKTKTPNVYYFDDISFSTTKSKNTIPLTPEQKKDTLTWAMENFISGMMKATKGKVKAWDVVNEPISGGDGNGDGYYDLWSTRNNPNSDHFYWQDYMGDEDYVRTAIRLARKYFEANGGNPSDLKLFINDYNLESDWDGNKKLKSMIHWVEVWEADGVTKVDGLGTQMHVACYANESTQRSKERAVEEMYRLMAATGKLVRVSELDMTYIDASGNEVATENMTEAQHKAMADYYTFIVKKYFEIVPENQQYGITHWSPTDNGWRGNTPVGLWDTNYNRKQAYYGFIEGLK